MVNAWAIALSSSSVSELLDGLLLLPVVLALLILLILLVLLLLQGLEHLLW